MCGTGKPFADCHMLDPSDPKAHSYWAAHLDDFARDRDAYAAAWRATMPDDPLSEHEPQDVIGLVRGALA
jgi:hypothetical protein